MYKIEIVNHPAGTVRIVTDTTPGREGQRFVQKADANCERCLTDAYVPHYNCLYAGKAIGHSEGHCTANACY